MYNNNLSALQAILQNLGVAGSYTTELGCWVQLASLLNQPVIPDGAIVTKNGDFIVLTTDGDFILTVNGFVPLNAMRTFDGSPIVTKLNEYITI